VLAKPIRVVTVSLFYALAYNLLDHAAFQFQSQYGISFWYAPAGLSMAVLLRFGIGYAPVYFLVSLIDSQLVWSMNPPLGWAEGFILTIPSVSTYTTAAFLLRSRLRVDFREEQLRSMVLFSAVTLCASAIVAATYIALLYLNGRIAGNTVGHTIRDFWIGDVIAHLSFVPFLLTVGFPWTASTIAFFKSPDLLRRLAPVLRRLLPQTLTTVLWFVLVAGIVTYSFGLPSAQVAPILYPCFLPLIFAAFWRGTKGAATGVICVCGAVALRG